MGQLNLAAFITDAFVYNYERLRIGGLIFASLLIAGGIGVLVYNKCKRKTKWTDNSSEI